MEAFIVRALCGGILLAIMAGPLGCCVIWRRMAYYGETIAHASLLGTALAAWLEYSSIWMVLALCLGMAGALWSLHRYMRVAMDTLLGIFSQATLAAGLVCMATLSLPPSLLSSLLFGDILFFSWADVRALLYLTLVLSFLLWKQWRALSAVMIQPELAAVEGVPVARSEAIFMGLLALFIAFCVKLVGVLLITALLIIPAATARLWARSPEQMAWMASLIGIVGVIGGMICSVLWDIPTGPSIVLTCTACMIAFQINSYFYK